MTRALYRPGCSTAPLPDGDAMPRGAGPEAREQRDDIAAVLTDPEEPARVAKPLHATGDQYEVLVAERMRTMTLAERIDIEIALTQRFRRLHTFEYDPLKY
jgi:precorrin-6B methylase 1